MSQQQDLYLQLCKTARKLEQWYDIDKVKTYAVYVWTKEESGYPFNVFDILSENIQWYTDFPEHYPIPEEALTIIAEVQKILKEFER